MRLRDFRFDLLKTIVEVPDVHEKIKQILTLQKPVHIAIRMGDGPWYEEPTIGETLKVIPEHFADAEITDCRWFFDTFVIELEEVNKEKEKQND